MRIKKFKSIFIIFSIFTFLLIMYCISAIFFEPKAYNFFVQNFSAYKTGSNSISLVVIDDKSLDKYRWPWKRELYADIFNYFSEYANAKIIGFDAIIATPDLENPHSDEVFYKAISKIPNLVIGFVPLRAKYDDIKEGEIYDKAFAQKFGFSSKIVDVRNQKPPTYYRSLSKFPQRCFDSVYNTGSVITTPDLDGYIRSIDQFVAYKGDLYPSLSLKMYSYLNPDVKFIISDKHVTSDNKALKIPVHAGYNGIVNNIKFYKNRKGSEYAHETFSAIDIIESYRLLKQGKKPLIEPQQFNNKIIFVGANAKAIAVGLEDVKRTPMSNNYPGVDIQATNFDNLLNNEFLIQTSLTQDILSLLVLLTATFLVIKYLSLVMSVSITAGIMFLYVVFCAICYRFGLVISVITPITLQVIVMAMAYSYRFILEGRSKEKIKNAMGKYISKDVMQNVVKNIDKLKLGGKRANVTVLFADIRGFTSMSEKMPAEAVSNILNEYFTEIEPIIAKYNGVINKFIGDAVMAIFGEPIQDKDHAQNAVKCAYEMLEKVAELRKKWLAEGKPKIEIGVGINTGEAFVGNIGSETRLEYTVIGDVVNLASRIESYNKVYKTSFLISSSTYQKVRNIADVIKISEVKIRGKQNKLDIYEVLRVTKSD